MKKIIQYAIIIVIVILAVAAFLIFRNFSWNKITSYSVTPTPFSSPNISFEVASEKEFKEFETMLKNYPEAQKLLVKAEDAANKIKSDSNNYDLYIESGLYWNGMGDYILTSLDKKNSVLFYNKAIKVYQKAIEVSSGKAWIPYLNLGNTMKKIGDFTGAEKSYRETLNIAPGEGMLWINLVEFYRFDLKKNSEEIKQVYKDGLKRVVVNADLLRDFAGYLRDIGEIKDALDIYKQLLEKYPENKGIQDQIKELERELNQPQL